jgi:hypothetical protein
MFDSRAGAGIPRMDKKKILHLLQVAATQNIKPVMWL